MLTCKEASRLVSESLDHRLRLTDRLGLRIHLLICRACERFAAQAQFLRRAARRAGCHERARPGIRLPAAARRRIIRVLQRNRSRP